MATDPDTLAQGADNDLENQLDPNAEASRGADEYEPTPYDDLARELGWTPPDQYQGDPKQFKSAEQFIRDGRDIQRDTASRLKSLQTTVDNMARTTGSIVEQEVKRRVDELSVRYAKAVDDGDTVGAFKLAGEIKDLTETPTAPAKAPSAESQSFVERNSSWFKKPGHEYETARAIHICNELAAQGYSDHGEQLRIAEQQLKREFPQLFGMNGKPQAGVNRPGSRGPSSAPKEKGFADLPLEAQKAAESMAEKPQLTNGDPEAFKKRYAINYWRNAEGKA